MLKNYLKIVLRNLRKNPAYSAINIAGLAIGIACCILMLLYVQDELSFDKFHSKADRIYRIVETQTSPEGIVSQIPFTMGPVGPALVTDFPEIESTVRMRTRWGMGRFAVGYQDNRFYEGDAIVTEQGFFDIFDFKLILGNPESALAQPQSVVLTKSAALKYLGDENPMGKVLETDRAGPLTVTGLLEDPPGNSHLDFSMLISFSTLPAQSPRWQEFIDNWQSTGFLVYLMADRPIDVDLFNTKLPAFLEKYRDLTQETKRELALQPLKDIHFQSAHIQFDANANKGQPAYLYIFSVIAFFVLVIACINYMNLATARSMKRAREIGMRKVVGAAKRQLIGQFLSESVLLSGIGLIFAVAIVQLVLPAFNTLANKDLHLAFGASPLLTAMLFLLMLAVGILSGSYPAFYLSRLSPAVVFKGELKTGARGNFLRRALVVTQFALSIIMIVSTVVAYKQLEFIRSKNLGFNQEHLIVIDINSGNTRRAFETIKAEMAKVPAVQSVSVSSRVPGEWKNISQINAVPENAPITDAQTMFFYAIDEDFLQTFEIDLIAGRNLSGAMGTDTSAIIINEAAARLFGWQEPLGKVLRVPANDFQARVVGVVKDFHFQSLHEEIAPLVLGHWNNPFYPIDYFTCRVEAQSIPQTLAALQRVHEQFDQVTPFEFNFLDERLNDFYQTDIRVGKIFGIAASLTIFIACLGLFGLAAFTAEQRTKEIGVRKVLGATVPNIILLVSNDFTKLVLLATVIASPIAWLALTRWLENFAYRISIGLDTFVIAGAAALLIALLTVSFQAIKAALANPVEALRYE